MIVRVHVQNVLQEIVRDAIAIHVRVKDALVKKLIDLSFVLI